MKAVVQERYGSPDGLFLREIDKPVIGDDQVLVRVRAASVNALDWHFMRRLPHLITGLLRAPTSRIRGVDLAGQIESVGRNVTRFKPGDDVFGVALGAFAEYAATREDRLAPKPRTLSFAQAAAIPVAGCTALQGLRDRAQVGAGQRVLVYGAGGGVGTFTVQVAKALGAHVTAVTRTENMELVRSIGAEDVIDYAREDFVTRGGRYDVFFDLGGDRSLADCRRVLVPSGKLVMCGAPSGFWALLPRLIMTLYKPRGGSRPITYMAKVRPEDLGALKDLAEAGKLSPVIDREYPLSEAADAVRRVGSRAARGKVVIRVA